MKFQRAVYKGPIRQKQNNQDLTKRAFQKAGMSVGLLGAGDLANSLTEIEEESNPYVNNGLPVLRSFSGITRNQ